MRRLFPLVVLLLAAPLLLGLEPGPQLSEEEAVRQAELAPRLVDLVSRPTVEVSAFYDGGADIWRVVLIEQGSGAAIARLAVDDDTGRARGVRVYPEASTAEFPTLSEEEAIKLARAAGRVREELSRRGPESAAEAEYEDGSWIARFWVEEDGDEEQAAEVKIDDDTWQYEYVWVGEQVGWQMARGDFGAYGKQANYWYVWGPMALVFALAFWRLDRLFSLRNLDVLALLGFLVSHGFFRAGLATEAVYWWYPPLLYLLFRSILMGFGVGERVGRTSNLPTWALFGLAALAGGFVVALNLDSRVIDVGYAGVVGADLILNGELPYGNFPDDVGTGDTYGPLNYLLYVPFVAWLGFSGEWDFLPAAHGLTIAAFVVGTLALVVAGRRLSGWRAAGALALAWTVFPYTLYSTNNNTNDVVVAAVACVGLALVTSPFWRGATILAGFAIKLYPLLLVPLWALHDDARIKPALRFALGGLAVVLLSFWILFLGGDPIEGGRTFYERTLEFQSGRDTPWSIFDQVPQTAFLQDWLLAAAILLALATAVFPRKRTVRRLVAFSAAVVILFQLSGNYWFYPYVTWFQPFVFLALLVETNEKTTLDGEASGSKHQESEDDKKAGSGKESV